MKALIWLCVGVIGLGQARERDGIPADKSFQRKARANHFAEARLYVPVPAGINLAEARRRFVEDQKAEIGGLSAHCDCPDLEPQGTVESVELLGGEELDRHGAQVSFGVDVRMACACPMVGPAADTAYQHNYNQFIRALRRLKLGCVEGNPVYCAPFEAYLVHFEELCRTRFADQRSCLVRATALRGTSPGREVRLVETAAWKWFSYNMPCSASHLPSCERCIQFQMELTDSVEFVGQKRCEESGLKTLVYFRNLSCTESKTGPNPVYEAGCAP